MASGGRRPSEVTHRPTPASSVADSFSELRYPPPRHDTWPGRHPAVGTMPASSVTNEPGDFRHVPFPVWTRGP